MNQLQSFYTLTDKVLSKYVNHTFIETGTYLGDSVDLALNLGFPKVISIEIMEDLQEKNREKFRNFIDSGRLELITGDTSLLFENLVENLKERATFWLDAHQDLGPQGLKKCPLYDELESIKKSNIKNHTIMIDDMRCLDGRIHWSSGITIQGVAERIKQINENYKIVFESSPFGPQDIMVAYID